MPKQDTAPPRASFAMRSCARCLVILCLWRRPCCAAGAERPQEFVHRSARSAAPDRANRLPSISMPTIPTSPPASVLDAAALERLRELDPHGERGLLERVLNAFRSSSARLLPQLHAAQQQRDAAGVRHVAHTLKSSAATIGAIKLSTLCAEIESMIRLGQFDAVQGHADALEGELASALRALARALPQPTATATTQGPAAGAGPEPTSEPAQQRVREPAQEAAQRTGSGR